MNKVLKKSLVIMFGSCASLFSIWTLKTYLKRRKYRHIPGPPTKGIYGFYFGNMEEVIKNVEQGGTYFDLLLKWIKQYGSVIKFQFLNRMVVATVDPDAVKNILITEVFPKEPLIMSIVAYPFSERFLGVGLVSEPNFEQWRHKRGILNPFFHKRSLIEFLGEFNSKGDILMEHLRQIADGKQMITLIKEFNHITLDAIASIAFGMDVDAINDPTNNLNKYLFETLSGMEALLYDPFIILKPHRWSEMKKMKTSIRKLRNLGREQILKRMKMKEENQECQLPNDMLTLFLKEQNDNKNVKIDDMIDEFVTFFFAGQETTANTLGFAVQALGRNPLVLKKLQEELYSVLGSRKEIKYEDLTNLKYTTCVIKETLRLWPIAAGLSRVTKGEFKIKEHNIPNGTIIQVSSYASSRLEQFFENPLEFVPERWTQKVNTENNQTYACFPFSLGPRNCIGQNFAMMEAKVVLAKFIANFNFVLDKNQNFEPKETITLTPTDGVRCILSLRDN